MEKEYRKRGRIVVAIALLQLIGAVALMAFGAIKGFLTGTQGNFLIAGSLVLYWVLNDIVEPKVAHRFDNITQAQKDAYPKYILWDLVGYAGIAYFLLGMGSSQNGSLIGAIIYAVSMKPKRESQDIFWGRTVPEEEPDGETDEEASDEMPEEMTAIEQQETEE